ncbi:Pentatricopeptide repeat-containing protein [Nymphaea thermarum]|nr:Pentatricopeptide repeat-containing protein [Nymphaea thermarum]
MKLGKVDEAFDFLEQIERRQRRPMSSPITSLSMVCARARELIAKGVFPNKVTFNMLINGLCKSSNLEEGFRLRDRMLATGVAPNLGMMENTKELLREMDSNGIVPDGFTYNIPFDGHSRCGNLDAPMELLERTVKKGIQISAYTCNVLVNGLCKAGKMTEAQNVLKRFCKAGKMTEA